MVEHAPEERSVGGSIPLLGTSHFLYQFIVSIADFLVPLYQLLFTSSSGESHAKNSTQSLFDIRHISIWYAARRAAKSQAQSIWFT